MFTKVEPFLLYSLSSVHAGSGSEVGLVDLPIQREKHTGFPKIESSSLKGALRMTVTDVWAAESNQAKEKADKIRYTFGASPEEAKAGDILTSAAGFADARILFFPVKSLRGVFAWVTCPYVLQRFSQELALYGSDLLADIKVPIKPGAASKTLYIRNEQMVLEEYTFTVEQSEEVRQFAQRIKEVLFGDLEHSFVDHVVVLEDDDFNDFVHLSTEVNTRIRMNPETGTVEDGALFNEENLPQESILYSFLFASHVRQEASKLAADFQTAEHVVSFLQDETVLPNVFQLGGNSTLGRGMLRLVWA